MLVGEAFLPPSFPPSRTQAFYIIKRQNFVYFCNTVYILNNDNQCASKKEAFISIHVHLQANFDLKELFSFKIKPSMYLLNKIFSLFNISDSRFQDFFAVQRLFFHSLKLRCACAQNLHAFQIIYVRTYVVAGPPRPIFGRQDWQP